MTCPFFLCLSEAFIPFSIENSFRNATLDTGPDILLCLVLLIIGIWGCIKGCCEMLNYLCIQNLIFTWESQETCCSCSGVWMNAYGVWQVRHNTIIYDCECTLLNLLLFFWVETFFSLSFIFDFYKTMLLKL